jgi:HK97 family phage major capsid protein
MYVTRQLWDDHASLQGFIHNELAPAVTNQVNYRLLQGDGTSPNLLGLLKQPNTLTRTFTPSTDAGSPTEIDTLVQVINDVRTGPAFGEADLILLNPTDWTSSRLIKNSFGP